MQAPVAVIAPGGADLISTYLPIYLVIHRGLNKAGEEEKKEERKNEKPDERASGTMYVTYLGMLHLLVSGP